jgi:hypothetical protein
MRSKAPVIAGKSDKHVTCFQVPHLERLVPRHRDRSQPVLTQGHAIDFTTMAGEGTQLAPALYIPHFQRLVRGRGNRPASVTTQPMR